MTRKSRSGIVRSVIDGVVMPNIIKIQDLLPGRFHKLRRDHLLNPVRFGARAIFSILSVVVSLSLCASANAALHTIQPLSPLPALTDPVVINGTTSEDYVGTPVIVLDGSLAGADTNGLTIEGGDSTVRGLVVQNFSGAGIRLDLLGSNTVAGNYVGTDATGTLDAGNGTHGISIYGPSTGNTIGGTNTADRNLISGNDVSGISADQSGNNIIQGNYVGTTVGGTGAIGNTNTGIVIFQADGNLVGGVTAGAGNVVSGNGENGIDLSTASTNTVIQGNRIGTNALGTGSLGNGHDGIHISGSTSQVGGTATGAGNLISGNGRNGLHSQGHENTVEGNFIGTDVTGTSDRNNSWAGIGIDGLAYDNLIGGTTADAGNIIAFNGRQGLIVTGTSTVGNRVSGNSIHSNVAMGI
ncbi:MAG: hypothetical protein GY780_04760, partial [bacterium]|nr:hypothetical protein [bacterium]